MKKIIQAIKDNDKIVMFILGVVTLVVTVAFNGVYNDLLRPPQSAAASPVQTSSPSSSPRVAAEASAPPQGASDPASPPPP